MSPIKNEIPGGTIDGVNNIFTTSESATQIILVVRDGASTSNFVYDSGTKEITLTYAPESSIQVVYSTGTGVILSSGEVLEVVNSIPLNGTTTYNLPSVVKQIVYASYDGVSTMVYSTSGSTITFSQIPQNNIGPIIYIGFADGISGDLTDNSTLNELILRFYSIVKEKVTSSVYKLEDVRVMLNELQDAVCTGGYTTLKDKQIKSPALKFIEAKKYYTYFSPFQLKNNFNTDTVEIVVTTKSTKVPASSGYLYYKENVIQYDQVTLVDGVLTFSGLSNVQVSGEEGGVVTLLYELPKKYIRDTQLSFISSQHGKQTIEFRDVRDEQGDYKTLQYEKVSDLGKTFINIMNTGYDGLLVDQTTVSLYYFKRPTDMSSTINSILPDKYAVTILPYLVASRFLNTSGSTNDAMVNELIGVAELRRLYQEYGMPVTRYRQKVKVNNYFHPTGLNIRPSTGYNNNN